MKRSRHASGLAIMLVALSSASAAAQVRVNPTGVNVNSQGATTVFLTFGGLAGYQPTEAFWCGELISAAPAIGLRCDPGTILGHLPLRYDRSTTSGLSAMTDIMTIPPSVSRRAYQAAESGAPSAFFYVRRFQSTTGGPDQYVAVTCRLTGGGARTPLSLTDVRVGFTPDVPVLHIAQGDALPGIEATIRYTGTGRLSGRWEIVLPGEELPAAEDLLTEATLPLELRGTQRRYTQLSRFNVFLPPTGRVVLEGPDPARLPTTTDGVHYLLLRIEATTEKEGDSDLGAVGAGTGVVPAGAVAGFPMPVLRYVVGSGQSVALPPPGSAGSLILLTPGPGVVVDAATPATFSWQASAQAALYTIEFESVADGEPVFSAIVAGDVAGYRVPSWFAERFAERFADAPLRWRVRATDAGGRELSRSAWRAVSF